MVNVPTSLRELLLLALCDRTGPVTATTLRRKLKRDVADRCGWTTDAWPVAFEQALQEHCETGLVAAEDLQLTPIGQQHVQEFLRAPTVLPGMRWTVLRNRELMMRALDLQPRTAVERKRVATAAGLRAVVIARHFALPVDPLPTAPQILQQVAWLQLQAADGPPVNGSISARAETASLPGFNAVNAIRATLLDGNPGPVDALLAARATGLSTTSIADLRDAVLHHWLDQLDHAIPDTDTDSGSDGSPGTASRNPIIDDAPVESTPLPELDTFVCEVLDVARSQPERYGENKVFIATVRQAWLDRFPRPRCTPADFDALLLSARQAGLVSLARADFVGAMNRADVHASELRSPYAVFHFVRLPD